MSIHMSIQLLHLFDHAAPVLAHAGEEGGIWEIFKHLPPAHPILVNFTAALIPTAIGADLIGRWRGRESLASVGWWLIALAAVVTPFTALAGWLWLGDMGGGDRPAMVVHKWLGTAIAAVVVAMALWRWSIRRWNTPRQTPRQTAGETAGETADIGPGAAYLVVGVLFVLSLAAQGHLGGMMSFGSSEGGGHEHVGHAEADHATDHAGGHVEGEPSTSQPSAGGLQWRDSIPVADAAADSTRQQEPAGAAHDH